tara:strand:+ start:649 stop:1614 length:966 start_codon:yes stop_codon:yes gene_type:complete
MIKKISINLLIIIFSFIFAFFVCEIILRFKHSISYDYDIEQWKYAKKLKIKHVNPKIGHIHLKNSSAFLQGVEIKTNKYGQRDKNYNNEDLNKFDRSFLFIGSSITLGWGVEYERTFIQRLNKLSDEDGKKWIYINGGIGNYNTERYVNNYFDNWKDLDFSDIAINFFVNDTEIINQDNSNFFTRHFQTGVILWKYINSLKFQYSEQNLSNYYKMKYMNDFKGFKVAKMELQKISDHCKREKKKCHLILMPDIHQLNPYKLHFINEKMKKISQDLNFNYHDLLPALEDIRPSNLLWNKYNDPHPNILAHELISESLNNFFK